MEPIAGFLKYIAHDILLRLSCVPITDSCLVLSVMNATRTLFAQMKQSLFLASSTTSQKEQGMLLWYGVPSLKTLQCREVARHE